MRTLGLQAAVQMRGHPSLKRASGIQLACDIQSGRCIARTPGGSACVVVLGVNPNRS